VADTVVLTCQKCGKVFLEIFKDTDYEGSPEVVYRDVDKLEAVAEILRGASQQSVYCPDCWKDWRTLTPIPAADRGVVDEGRAADYFREIY
jgi:hypothetical protein